MVFISFIRIMKNIPLYLSVLLFITPLFSEDLHFSFGQLDTVNHTLEIMMESFTPWDGGMLEISGINNIVGIEPGLSMSEFYQMVTWQDNTVLIFSMLGWLPVTSGVYFTIEYDSLSSESICFEYAYFVVNQPYWYADVTFGPCIEFFECTLPGDINNDNTTDILDIVTLIFCIMEGTYCQCSDINSDSSGDVLDILQIINIIFEN